MKYRITTLLAVTVVAAFSARAQDAKLVRNTGVATKATAQTCNAAIRSDLDLYNTDRLSTISPKELIARRNFMIACSVYAPNKRQYFDSALSPIENEIANRYTTIISEAQECKGR